MSTIGASDRRLRVLQCITRFGLGGAERVAFAIVDGLKAEIDFGFFTVYRASTDAVGAEMQRYATAHAIPWERGTAIPLKAGGMVPGGWALARALRRFEPDVVHFHSETPEACGAVASLLLPPTRRPALVRTIHNSVFWRFWPRIGRWCDRRLARAHIACVSEAAREEFLRYRGDSGAPPPPENPVVIYNGVASPSRPPHAAPHRADLRRVLFAGRFEDQKGTDVLCAALPRVRLPAGVGGELVMIGQGAHAPVARQLAAHPPAGWTVVVRPPTAGLDTVFPEFDLVVIPSRFEGLCLVAIEAALAGRPLVVTDAPGLREVVPVDHPWRAIPGDAGSLAQALTSAIAHTTQWDAMVRGAQSLAHARFAPAAMAAGYRELYSRAAEETSPRSLS